MPSVGRVTEQRAGAPVVEYRESIHLRYGQCPAVQGRNAGQARSLAASSRPSPRVPSQDVPTPARDEVMSGLAGESLSWVGDARSRPPVLARPTLTGHDSEHRTARAWPSVEHLFRRGAPTRAPNGHYRTRASGAHNYACRRPTQPRRERKTGDPANPGDGRTSRRRHIDGTADRRRGDNRTEPPGCRPGRSAPRMALVVWHACGTPVDTYRG